MRLSYQHPVAAILFVVVAFSLIGCRIPPATPCPTFENLGQAYQMTGLKTTEPLNAPNGARAVAQQDFRGNYQLRIGAEDGQFPEGTEAYIYLDLPGQGPTDYVNPRVPPNTTKLPIPLKRGSLVYTITSAEMRRYVAPGRHTLALYCVHAGPDFTLRAHFDEQVGVPAGAVWIERDQSTQRVLHSQIQLGTKSGYWFTFEVFPAPPE